MMLDFFRSCIVRVGSKSLLFIDIYGIFYVFCGCSSEDASLRPTFSLFATGGTLTYLCYKSLGPRFLHIVDVMSLAGGRFIPVTTAFWYFLFVSRVPSAHLKDERCCEPRT